MQRVFKNPPAVKIYRLYNIIIFQISIKMEPQHRKKSYSELFCLSEAFILRINGSDFIILNIVKEISSILIEIKIAKLRKDFI